MGVFYLYWMILGWITLVSGQSSMNASTPVVSNTSAEGDTAQFNSGLSSPRDFMTTPQGDVFIISEGFFCPRSSLGVSVRLLTAFSKTLKWNVNLCSNETERGIAYTSSAYDAQSDTLYVAYKTLDLINSLTFVRSIQKGSALFPIMSFNSTFVHPCILAVGSPTGNEQALFLLTRHSLFIARQPQSADANKTLSVFKTFSSSYLAVDMISVQDTVYITGMYTNATANQGYFVQSISMSNVENSKESLIPAMPDQALMSDSQISLALSNTTTRSVSIRKSSMMFCADKLYILFRNDKQGSGLGVLTYDASNLNRMGEAMALLPPTDVIASLTCLDTNQIHPSSFVEKGLIPSSGLLLLIQPSQVPSSTKGQYLLFLGHDLHLSLPYSIPASLVTSTDPSMNIVMASIQSVRREPLLSALMFAYSPMMQPRELNVALMGVHATFRLKTDIPFYSFYSTEEKTSCSSGYYLEKSTRQCFSCTDSKNMEEAKRYAECITMEEKEGIRSVSGSKLAIAIVFPLLALMGCFLVWYYRRYRHQLAPYLPHSASFTEMKSKLSDSVRSIKKGFYPTSDRKEYVDLGESERKGKFGNVEIDCKGFLSKYARRWIKKPLHSPGLPTESQPLSISGPTLVSSSAMNRASPFPDQRYSIPQVENPFTQGYIKNPTSFASVPLQAHRSSHHLAPGSKSLAALEQAQQPEHWENLKLNQTGECRASSPDDPTETIHSMLPTPAVSVYQAESKRNTMTDKTIGAADLEHLIQSLDQEADNRSLQSSSIHLSTWSPKRKNSSPRSQSLNLTSSKPARSSEETARRPSWATHQNKHERSASMGNEANTSPVLQNKKLQRSMKSSDLPPLAPSEWAHQESSALGLQRAASQTSLKQHRAAAILSPSEEKADKRGSCESDESSDYMKAIYKDVF